MKYILVGEVASKLSGNQEVEGVIYEITLIFLENKMGSKFYSQREAMDWLNVLSEERDEISEWSLL